jgi:hypothetical protein
MIIWIASYPKSGNTWIRSLLSTYLYSDKAIFNFELLNKILQFPDKKNFEYFTKDFSDIKKISDYWMAAQDRINLFNNNEIIFLKTHSALCTLAGNSFTNKNNTKAAIYIVRDPRNLITSFSHHYSMSAEESYNFLISKNKILTEGEWGSKNFGISAVLGSWNDHYKSWKNINFAPILILKYEDLIRDTKKSLIKIINFLNKFMKIELDEKKVKKVINSCSFEKLAEMEKKYGFEESVKSKKNNKKLNFFYLGKKNNWENLLNPQVEEKVRKAFNKEMKELDYI